MKTYVLCGTETGNSDYVAKCESEEKFIVLIAEYNFKTATKYKNIYYDGNIETEANFIKQNVEKKKYIIFELEENEVQEFCE